MGRLLRPAPPRRDQSRTHLFARRSLLGKGHPGHRHSARRRRRRRPQPEKSDMSGNHQSWKRWIARHEVILLVVLIAEVIYFLAVGLKFGTADNIANIIRQNSEVGL